MSRAESVNGAYRGEVVDSRVEAIPAGKRYGTQQGEVVHYATSVYPINSFGAQKGRSLCGRRLWLPIPCKDRRICEDCWTMMVARGWTNDEA